MADLLIKGMEMPMSCDQCRLWLLFLGRYICFGKGVEIDNEQFPYEFMSKHTLPDCPLVELPPHGRLIDADKLTSAILSCMVAKKAYSKKDFGLVKMVIYHIVKAPTVLEAST